MATTQPSLEHPATTDQPGDDRPAAGHEIQRTVEDLTPWAVSLLLHLGIGLLAAFATWLAPADVDEQPITIPIINPAEIVPVEPLTPTRTVDLSPAGSSADSIPSRQVSRPAQARMDLDLTDAVPTIGISGLASAPDGLEGNGDGAGSGLFDGDDTHHGGRAMSVIFVIDASGSLVDSLPFVISELQARLGRLQQQQRFGVVFFQRDDFIDVTRGLRPATRVRVAEVRRRITLESGNIVPGGSSNPVRAIERAISQRPELICLLSDNITGSGPYAIEQDALLEKIRQAKQRYRADTRINTIQFLHDDPLRTLEKIAAEHQGTSVLVTSKMIDR